jgi:phosphopantothenoylcysteine synthetase/decarboxylase
MEKSIMTGNDIAYLIITGAGTARRAPEIIQHLAPRVGQLLTLMTPNASRIISPRELALVPGHRVVESYFDAAILPRPPRGLILVAPCDFNSLNKIAQGIADSLALSIIAEAIGRQTPVIVAVSVNEALWRHPRAAESVAALRRWGCSVIEPWVEGDVLTLAPTDTIMELVQQRLGAAIESESNNAGESVVDVDGTRH